MQLAPPAYVLGQIPSVLNHVERHLSPTDAWRKHFECIAARLGLKDADDPRRSTTQLTVEEKTHEVEREGEKIVSAMRGRARPPFGSRFGSTASAMSWLPARLC